MKTATKIKRLVAGTALEQPLRKVYRHLTGANNGGAARSRPGTMKRFDPGIRDARRFLAEEGNENVSLCLNAGPPLSPRQGIPITVNSTVKTSLSSRTESLPVRDGTASTDESGKVLA
jgi:hypothetical protein